MGRPDTINTLLQRSSGRSVRFVTFRTTILARWGTTFGGALGWHPLALLVILLALLPLVVGDTVWSADIGARLYQARVLTTTGDWISAHPLPRADPDGQYFPLHFALGTDSDFQFITLAKHPLWTWSTAGLFRLGGLRAVVGLQTLSTFAASVGAARYMSLTRPRLAIPTLWFTGVVSPLFFDGYIGYGHSLAAALLIWAAYVAVRFAKPNQSTTELDGLRLVGSAVLVACACLVRTEAVLAGIALAAGFAAVAWTTRSSLRWVLLAATTTFTVGATVVIDRILAAPNDGLANRDQIVDSWGFVDGRVAGLQQTWLSPGRSSVDIMILASAAIVLTIGFLARERSRGLLAEAGLGVALAAVGARILQPDPILIFGLIMACPLLVVGFVRSLPMGRREPETRIVTVAFALYSMAVLATQYPYGGVAEWGGRYFAAGVPFAAVAAVLGLDQVLATFPANRARRLAALAVVSAVALNLAGVYSLSQSRSRTGDMVEEIAEAMATTAAYQHDQTDGAPADRPIVVTTTAPVGRLSWDIVDQGRWLLVDRGELLTVAERLTAMGVDRFTLVTFAPEDEVPEISAYYEPWQWPRTSDVPGDVIIMAPAG